MRSADLARLAGVTVRTLRHYHQVGALPEPPRTSNGYREYRMQHLVRVLRIRQLSSLGIPLDQAASILDAGDKTASSAELLDQLDKQLAEQVERITHQRELIARLRSYEATPDLPAELVPFSSLFAADGYSGRVAEMDRDQAILLSHFADDAGKSLLESLYQEMAEHPELLTAYADLTHRFAVLDTDSTTEQIADLAEQFITLFAQLVTALYRQVPVTGLERASELLQDYAADTFNPAQRKVLDLLARGFSHLP